MTSNRSPRQSHHRSHLRTARLLTAGALGTALALAALPPVASASPHPAAARTTASAVRTGATIAPPVGKLQPSGCDRSTATVTCDLWAKPDTTQVLGQPLPIWGFSTTEAGTATAPGPVLVVQQGDDVALTLHNRIGEPMSLALPGQPTGQLGAGLTGGEAATTAAGAATTYHFTAARPGTFVYEAGHTANGTRQVAMGLAGALVVLPADPSGAYGSAATAYDDEAVLVLSEIDPELNANPDTFDMRSFHGRYRLINGKAFPSTDPIATDQNRRVLLRYADVGALGHSMGVMGADQRVVAQDAQPAFYGQSALVADLQPGATMDALVDVPQGQQSRFTLYETGGHLDNNGQTEGDPTQLAFGGMMTFLETLSPAPATSDGVGPVSSRVNALPNPADGRNPVTVTATVSDTTTGGSDVVAAELVVDDASSLGVGFGTPMTGTFGGPTADVSGTLPTSAPSCDPDPVTGLAPVALSCLSAGRHRVFVRGKDSAGNWGVVGMAVLNLPKTGPLSTNGSLTPSPANGARAVAVSATADDSGAGGVINRAEYSLDTLAAAGSGTPMTVNKPLTIASVDASIPASVVAGLAEGEHHVFVRAHDSLGLWGPELDLTLVVDKTGPTVTAAAVAPNPTNGQIDDPGNPGNLVVSGQVQDLSAGGGQENNVVDAEGFLNPGANPAPGTGFQLLAVDGAFDSPTEAVYGLIPLSAVSTLADGSYVVRVRAQDAAGNWGELYNAPLTVDKTRPVLGALTASPNPSNGATTITFSAPFNEQAVGGAELWYGLANADPGVGQATPVQVTMVNGRATVSVMPKYRLGDFRVNLRVKDLAGNWSNASSVLEKLTVAGTSGVAALLGFQSATGNIVVSTTAGMPNNGTNQGALITMPGGSNNKPAYVSTNFTQVFGQTFKGYKAGFTINPNTLNTQGEVVPVFEARTSGGGRVFSVQMRTTSATGPQMRAVMMRNGTLTNLVGAWAALPVGAHNIAVSWNIGPATGTGAGALQVKRDGVVIFGQTGDNRTMQIDSVRLGAIEGLISSTSGRMFIDKFDGHGRLVP